ncbi:uncharacterized protein LOC144169392 isoform X2 [Haemaphysalis longicornis]
MPAGEGGACALEPLDPSMSDPWMNEPLRQVMTAPVEMENAICGQGNMLYMLKKGSGHGTAVPPCCRFDHPRRWKAIQTCVAPGCPGVEVAYSMLGITEAAAHFATGSCQGLEPSACPPVADTQERGGLSATPPTPLRAQSLDHGSTHEVDRLHNEKTEVQAKVEQRSHQLSQHMDCQLHSSETAHKALEQRAREKKLEPSPHDAA